MKIERFNKLPTEKSEIFEVYVMKSRGKTQIKVREDWN